jgi:hypothetical protein
VNGLALWNQLTRREQRIMIKLFGGGSPHGDGPIEAPSLTRLGLITENGLTSAGLELFIAAFTKRNEMPVQERGDRRQLQKDKRT